MASKLVDFDVSGDIHIPPHRTVVATWSCSPCISYTWTPLLPIATTEVNGGHDEELAQCNAVREATCIGEHASIDEAMTAWNHAWGEYLCGKYVQGKEHDTPRGERVAPQQEVFAPFRRPASLILRQLSNFLTDLRSVIIANREELCANGAWERVVSLCPKLSKRFGVPNSLPVAGSYEEVRDGVLQATVRHFQSVLDAERAHAVSEARDAFRLALHQYGGSNKVVSRIVNGKDAYPDVCLQLDDGTSTYHPQKVLARASAAWS
eukprot:6474714-Amphidinium_carterae.1